MKDKGSFPKVWELLERFKEVCRDRGWKISDNEDIIEIENEYHNFIGASATYPSTFEKVAASRKKAVRNGKSYHPIEVSYIAWVFQKRPSEQLLKTLTDDPKLTRNTALYDLSSIYQGQRQCLGLNQTKSLAFKRFEKFLKEKYGVETKPLYEPQRREPKTFKSKLTNTPIS